MEGNHGWNLSLNRLEKLDPIVPMAQMREEGLEFMRVDDEELAGGGGGFKVQNPEQGPCPPATYWPTFSEILPENHSQYEAQPPTGAQATIEPLWGGRTTKVILYGRTEQGTSVALKVHGFKHRAVMPCYSIHHGSAPQLDALLDEARKFTTRQKGYVPTHKHMAPDQWPLQFEVAQRRPLWFYHPSPKDPLTPDTHWVVFIYSPCQWLLRNFISHLKSMRLSSLIRFPGSSISGGQGPGADKVVVHEANVDLASQLSWSTGVYAMCWARIPAHHFRCGTVQPTRHRETWQTLELDVFLTGRQRLDVRQGQPPPLLEPISKDKIAPLVTLCFDTEFKGQGSSFPQVGALDDELFMLNAAVMVHGQRDLAHRACFALEPIELDKNKWEERLAQLRSEYQEGQGSSKAERFLQLPDQLFVCRDVVDLLNKFRAYVCFRVNPDVITGYNIFKFDCEYVTEYHEAYLRGRGVSAGLASGTSSCARSTPPLFHYLGRSVTRKMRSGAHQFDSGSMGNNDQYTWTIPGRVTMDVIFWLKKNRKFASYALNKVAELQLGLSKVEVSIEEMNEARERRDPDYAMTAALYCQMDADLPLHLCAHNQIITTTVLLGTITNTKLSDVFVKGEQLKVFNLLMSYCQLPEFHLYNNSPADSGQPPLAYKYEGATVLEPEIGYYDDPVATLDFSSLYPSIMIGHNLCYSTYIPEDARSQVDPDAYEQVDCTSTRSHCFVKKNVYTGMLPSVLNRILTKRKEVKAQLKKTEDPTLREVLDGRQLALKVCANSVYGYTGVLQGRMPCTPIAETVTKHGREMIDFTRRTVEQRGSNRHVIYGDTDSVMVKLLIDKVMFPPQRNEQGVVPLIEEALRIGVEDAAFITQKFHEMGYPNIKLEFEKVFWPYVLKRKKHYIGGYWTQATAPDKADVKGDKVVRRDSPPLANRTLKKMYDKICLENDLQGAVDVLHEQLRAVVNHEVPLDDYVFSKSLKRTYKNDSDLMHVAVNKKRAARAPGTEAKPGDRIPMVILRGKTKNSSISECAEDPEYVRSQGWQKKIDRAYYLKTHLFRSVREILGRTNVRFEPILDWAIGEIDAQNMGVKRLSQYWVKAPDTLPSAKAPGETHPLADTLANPDIHSNTCQTLANPKHSKSSSSSSPQFKKRTIVQTSLNFVPSKKNKTE